MARDGYSVEAAIEKGRPLPDWAQNIPELLPGEDFYMKAFFDLSTCREVGNAIGPIPWNIIIEYAKHSGLDRDTTSCFVQIIRQMDSEYLDIQQNEMKRQQEIAKGNK